MSAIREIVQFHNVAELEPLAGGGGLQLHRFPREVREALGFKAHTRGRFYAHRCAGCEIRFVTAGPFVALTLAAQQHDTFAVVYCGDRAHSRHELPAGRASTIFLETPPTFAQVDPAMLARQRFAPQVWRITFHQDAIVAFHQIEGYGHAIRPPLPGELPRATWLAYGSSITYGANALHPSNAYVQQAAWRLGVDALNKGLPGSCMCEPVMAEYLAGQTPEIFTLELGVNMAELATPDEFRERACGLIDRVAATGRRLFVIDIFPNRADHGSAAAFPAAANNAKFREIVRAHVAGMRNPKVTHIEAAEILRHAAGLHVDLVHPSDEGHIAMGQALADRMRED
jgi:hypothetical protein